MNSPIFCTTLLLILIGGSLGITNHGCNKSADEEIDVALPRDILNVIDSNELVPTVKRYNYKINEANLNELLLSNVKVEFDQSILFDRNFRELYRVKKIIKPESELSFLTGTHILVTDLKGQIREATKNIMCGWCYNYTIKGDLYYNREKEIKEFRGEDYEGYSLVVHSVKIDSVRP